jgi:(p)ppGpp synthase/HD superfamily hydrolase
MKLRPPQPSIRSTIARASFLHRDQRYGAQSYNAHLSEVAKTVKAMVVDTKFEEDALHVAWLHDAVEDKHITLKMLKKLGYNNRVIDALNAITKRDDESYEDYLKRVMGNKLAKKVKIADVTANLNENIRTGNFIRSYKYMRALATLTGMKTDISQQGKSHETT